MRRSNSEKNLDLIFLLQIFANSQFQTYPEEGGLKCREILRVILFSSTEYLAF